MRSSGKGDKRRREPHQKNKNKRRRDNFNRLPDDVILVIFNDLWDAKLLFRCSMVCKRFASLTSQVHNLYLSLSHTQLDPYDPNFFDFYMDKILPRRVTDFFEDLDFLYYRPPLKQFDSFDDDLLESLDLSVVLSRFKEIRHLRLDFPPFRDGTGLDLIKCGVSISGEKIRTFTSLSIRTMCPIGHVPVRSSDEEEDIEFCYYPEDITRRLLCRDCLLVAVMRHLLSLVLIKTQPELRSISFNELGFRREEVISGDRIVELRELVSSTHWESLWGRVVDLKLSGMVSRPLDSLTLPVSGYVTNLGMLLAIQFGDGSGDAYFSGIPAAALLDCFPEQDDVPREAIAEIWRPVRMS